MLVRIQMQAEIDLPDIADADGFFRRALRL
jgi:hypothetical protein